MSESPLPDPEPDSERPPPPTTQSDAVRTFFVPAAAVALVLWAIAVVQAITKYSEYSDQRDSLGISAPQISQIAGEYLVAIAPWAIAAAAVSVVAILAGIWRLAAMAGHRI